MISYPKGILPKVFNYYFIIIHNSQAIKRKAKNKTLTCKNIKLNIFLSLKNLESNKNYHVITLYSFLFPCHFPKQDDHNPNWNRNSSKSIHFPLNNIFQIYCWPKKLTCANMKKLVKRNLKPHWHKSELN